MKILEKSNKNIESAKELIVADLYAPSVHASYYGSFLFMKYIGNHFLSLPYSQQDDPERAHLSHDSVWQTIQTSTDINIKRLLISKGRILHKMRREADYTNENISKEKAEQTFEISKEIRNNLATYFSIQL